MKKEILLPIVSALIVVLGFIVAILYSNNKGTSDKVNDTSNETANSTVAVTEDPPLAQATSDNLDEKEVESPTTDTPAREEIEWVIDTEDHSISANETTYLSDLNIHPLYASFLRNEISVASPYTANIEVSFFDDRKYTSEFEEPEKGFYLLDLTGDGFPELLFEIRNRWGSDRLLYILGIRDDELICYDLFETHTSHVGFAIYDNGVVESGYRFQNGEADSVYYRYNTDGSTYELIHFFRNIDPDSYPDLSHFYDYYYLDGNRDVLYELHSDEEYESVIEPYLGEFPEWLDCKDFADIPY